MRTLLLGMILEAVAGISVAGVLLALAVPALSATPAMDKRNPVLIATIVGVLVAGVVAAWFRPGSALRRYNKR